MGKVILLLIGVSSFKCTSSGCVSGAAHQQLQRQRVLGASGPQPSEWRNWGVQGETGAVSCDDTWLPPWPSAAICDRCFCCKYRRALTRNHKRLNESFLMRDAAVCNLSKCVVWIYEKSGLIWSSPPVCCQHRGWKRLFRLWMPTVLVVCLLCQKRWVLIISGQNTD